ncbi:MAG: MBL fold metallo-hydrolase [Methanophagales archaeon]|nr:MBL fold metallo-hydrolase [Methanophagales archaeon]
MKLRIVYDNEAKEGLESDWGFACLLEAEKSILFDTGASAEILSRNMQRLELKKEDIEIIALSHEHWDHIGGLDAVLHQNVAVYVPSSFTRGTKKRIEEKAAEVVEVSGPADIVPGVHTTGELRAGAGIKEQSLVLDTKECEGVVVLTGCAHPGLENILEAAKGFGELYGVIGGFHGFDNLKSLETLKMIIPCHCTVHKEEIRRRYSEKAVWCGAGVVIEI